jgi:signal transduction histidine kinase
MVQSLELDKDTKKKISSILDDTINEIRRMTSDLMPPALTDFGVGKAMSNFTDLIRKSSGVSVYYDDSTKSANSKLTPEINVCLFRVCQELINNSLKHSGAESINISLTEFDDKVSLYFRDNGKGFDVENVKHGSGLKNIRERIAVFDGYLHITSSNQGTEVEMEIPLS